MISNNSNSNRNRSRNDILMRRSLEKWKRRNHS
jgi:hypothetical protein